MKHIAIFNTSGDVQTALNEETLVNPYVALVSGAVDFNELVPAGPDYLGVWSGDGQGTYTFTILDDDQSKWGANVEWLIGTFKNAYMEDADGDIDVKLVCNVDNDAWHMSYIRQDASDIPYHTFEVNVSETWNDGQVVTDLDLSDSAVSADWNGTDTFVFTAHPDAPLVMLKYIQTNRRPH